MDNNKSGSGSIVPDRNIPGHYPVLCLLAVLVCMLGNFYVPPTWIWIEPKLIVYLFVPVLCFRIVTVLTTYRLHSIQIKRYVLLLLVSIGTLGLAINLFAWYANISFPAMFILYIIQWASDVQLSWKSGKEHGKASGGVNEKRTTLEAVEHKKRVSVGSRPSRVKYEKIETSGQQEMTRKKESVIQTVPQDSSSLVQKVVILNHSNDKRYAARLHVHLKPQIRDGLVDIWDETAIRPGDLWQQERSVALQSAAVIVILVSADFMACDLLAGVELPLVVARASRNNALLLRIHITACAIEGSGLERFHPINPLDKPLATINNPDREEIWKQTAHTICQRLGIRL